MGQGPSRQNQITSDEELIHRIFPNSFTSELNKTTKKTTIKINENVKPDGLTFDFQNFKLFVKSIGINIIENQGSNYDFSILNEITLKKFLFKNHYKIKKVVTSLIYIQQKQLAFEFLVFLKNTLKQIDPWCEFYRPYFTNKIKQSHKSDSNYDNKHQGEGATQLNIENMNHFSKEELLNILNDENLNLEFHKGEIGFINIKSQSHILNWETYKVGPYNITNLYRDLEQDHTLINWIFPNFFRSMINPLSRRLTLQERNAIIVNQECTEFYLKNFRMFMSFLGIKVNLVNEDFYMVDEMQFKLCVFTNTHNLIRLQRVFASLSVLGQRKLALSFLKFLKNTLNFLIYAKDFKHFEILKEEDNNSNISFEDKKNFYFQQDLLDQWFVTPLILTKQLINEEDYIKNNKTKIINQFTTNYNNYQKDLKNQFGQGNSSNNNKIQQESNSLQKEIEFDNIQKSLNPDHIIYWETYQNNSTEIKKFYNDLKNNHALIELIFPNFLQSIYNSEEIRLTLEERNEIISNKDLRDFYLNNFRMFMRFLGIKSDIVNESKVQSSILDQQQFKFQVKNKDFPMWMKRMFASLSVLGQRDMALNFLNFLKMQLHNLGDMDLYYINYKDFEIVKGEKLGIKSDITFNDRQNNYIDQDLLNKWQIGAEILTNKIILEKDVLKTQKQFEQSHNKVVSCWETQMKLINQIKSNSKLKKEK